MKQSPIIRQISAITIPLMFMFGVYVLLHSKVSAGGGFQGGAICATAYILQAMVFGRAAAEKLLSEKALLFVTCFGALVYSGFGFASVFFGNSFLNYFALSTNAHLGQFIGIMGIEVGVQLTVFASLSLIYLKLSSA